MTTQDLFNYFQNRQDPILNSIRTLVEIESPSYYVPGSLEVVNFLEKYASALEAVYSIDRFQTHLGEHLLIRAFGQNGENREDKILLVGHTDTVHPLGSKEKNPTRIENDKFYGCGIFDMKANIILMLEAVRAIGELSTPLNHSVDILLTCDEEIGSATGRLVLEREAQDAAFCLVCEPSANGRVKTGRKGTGMFTLKAHGLPAHAGLEPEKGASAILEISRQIEKLHALNDLQQGTTVNVCQIKGGTASNVIPAEAECTIDVRFTQMAEAERITNEIRSLKNIDERVSLEITGELNRPPLERSEKVVVLYERARKIAASFDYELGETQVGGASDGNFVAALGIPVLDGLGVAGNGAHTLDEHIFIDNIAARATLIAGLISDFRWES